jgi:hypothetical protein
MRNASFDQTMTAKQREDLKNKKASDTLKRGLGTQVDLDRLFASLAKAAGFDVNVMYSGNRDVSFFNHENDLNPNYIHHSGIAVRLDNIWKPFNPGVPYMPFGLTFPHDEIISTMIVGGGGFNWIRLPVVDHARNVTKRSAKLKLLDDGTLEGMVRIEHHGHSATIRRNDLFLRTPAERDERVAAIWKATLNNAEVTEVSIENFSDSSKPYIYSFKVKVPNYAQKTGKRLFIQPGFFEHSSRPLFSSDIRRYSIYFSHPWSEEDDVVIEYPKGYEPDNLETPGTVMESGGLGAVRFSLLSEPQSNVLKYKRNFYFGGKGKIIFPASAYKPLKVLFDGFHKADTQSVSLKQKQ